MRRVKIWQLGGEGDSKSKYTEPPKGRKPEEKPPPQPKLPDELL